MKEMFPPEKCPKCKADTVVMHYDNGYRVECPNNPECDWYDVFHFDILDKKGEVIGFSKRGGKINANSK